MILHLIKIRKKKSKVKIRENKTWKNWEKKKTKEVEMKQDRVVGAEIKEKRYTLIWKTPSQL